MSSDNPASEGRKRTSLGAYGFHLTFPESNVPSLDLVALDRVAAPRVEVTWRHAAPVVDVEEVGEDVVRLARRAGSGFCVSRRPPAITLDFAHRPPPESLVHPILTVPVSVLARWRGDLTLHAGAFETAAGAWGVVGEREAGKSTILALLAERGFPVVADDLLAVADGQVWAGPHCVDLRPDVAERFESARYVGEVGGRPRYRMSTPPGRPRIPLRGIFLLDWWDAPDVDLTPLDAREIISLIFRQEYIGLVGATDPVKVLDLGAVPAWRLSRPRAWAATQDAVERILEVAGAQA